MRCVWIHSSKERCEWVGGAPNQLWTGTEKRPGTLKRRPAYDRVLL